MDGILGFGERGPQIGRFRVFQRVGCEEGEKEKEKERDELLGGFGEEEEEEAKSRPRGIHDFWEGGGYNFSRLLTYIMYILLLTTLV